VFFHLGSRAERSESEKESKIKTKTGFWSPAIRNNPLRQSGFKIEREELSICPKPTDFNEQLSSFLSFTGTASGFPSMVSATGFRARSDECPTVP
jgi:hypothetical protein